MKILKGIVLSFNKNPFFNKIEDSVNIVEDGGILINDGIIEEVNNFSAIKNKYPLAKIYDYGKYLITAGFIDCHMHYPQTGIISSFGKRLIDWLNDYTFPEEKKLSMENNPPRVFWGARPSYRKFKFTGLFAA